MFRRRAGRDPSGRSRRPALTALAAALAALGSVCLLAWTGGALRAQVARARADRRLERIAAAHAVSRRPGRADPRAAAPAAGDPLGRIVIARIGLDAVVVEGDDGLTLSFAAGHVPGTALPGEKGNAALAGHRDGVFAPLARVQVGDAVVVTTPGGRYRYAVRSTEVVGPDATRVLDPTAGATLTLITCYPFRYIGAAPRRFVVRAVSSAGGPASRTSGAPQRVGSKMPSARFFLTLSQVKKRPFIAM